MRGLARGLGFLAIIAGMAAVLRFQSALGGRLSESAPPAVTVPAVVPAVDSIVATTTTAVTDTFASPPRDERRLGGSRCERKGDAEQPETLEDSVTFQCALGPGGRYGRLVASQRDMTMTVRVYTSVLADTAVQVLRAELDTNPWEDEDYFQGEDLNRDGWTDLKVQVSRGNGGTFYGVFRYDPGGRRFVRDSVLSGKSDVKPVEGEACVEIGAQHGGIERRCWERGRWVRDVGCRRTDPSPPRAANDTAWSDIIEDIRQGALYACTLRRGGEEARVKLVGDDFGIPVGIDVHAPGRPTQRLPVDGVGRPLAGVQLVTGEDLNRDGWADLKVMMDWGSGGYFYDVFMYRPRSRRFVKDTVLSGGGLVVPLEGPRPCVGTYWKAGMSIYTSDDWCWRGGRWVKVRDVEQTDRGAPPGTDSVLVYLKTTRELRGGRMEVVRVDTVRDTIM